MVFLKFQTQLSLRGCWGLRLPMIMRLDIMYDTLVLTMYKEILFSTLDVFIDKAVNQNN